MIIFMEPDASVDEINRVKKAMEHNGYKSTNIRVGVDPPSVNLSDPESTLSTVQTDRFTSVRGVTDEDKAVLLSARNQKKEDTVVRVHNALFGGGHASVIAGPCAVESTDQTLRVAQAVQASGARMLRGGAFKPRTSPYSFQGLGERGLKILAAVREETGLAVVTEALDPATAPLVARYSDMIQIGARNMQNFSLLEAVGRLQVPVLLKRGFSATLDELLASAEYLLANGCRELIVCERGIRTFSTHSRNTLDLGMIPVFKQRSHLPIIVDPSHATGRPDAVLPMAYAALSAGADGIMVDVHNKPDAARVDGFQALEPEAFSVMMSTLSRLAGVLNVRI